MSKRHELYVNVIPSLYMYATASLAHMCYQDVSEWLG